MKIIPAIDIINGKCVRLVQGNFGKVTVYSKDPVKVARQFEEDGFEFLHLVDLDGARLGGVTNWKVIEKIAENTALKTDFGGGVKTDEEIERLLGLGIDYINAGSLAVQQPDTFNAWLKKYGSDNFILSADVQHEMVKISGWQKEAGISVFDLIRKFKAVRHVTCTDISTDGMLNGPNITLYKKLKIKFPNLGIIASGGISTADDVEELNYLKLEGIIIGKALYEKTISAEELKNRNLL
ncbi:MAG: 1-(5-phosphoribosyl)-5-[(5-phosphoribosylamino)methylideneamino]imidazole-4-carboxamide isomerase [Flammeovirgaceae bacterium]|nr:MAG: 1-(5-phosphoribosyl)-5-[(5-phosphoribosylamino)methylideneamino]imidazole-4-carboxamide isomerase [Flammeovirgaceae bacterium]